MTGLLAVPPHRLADLRPHITTLMVASRNDQGCLLYAWAEDFMEPGVIRMVEHWASWADFEAHDRSPHAEAIKAALAPVGLLRREMWVHEGGQVLPI